VNVNEGLLDAGRFFSSDHLLEGVVVGEGALNPFEPRLGRQRIPFQERRALLEHERQIGTQFQAHFFTWRCSGFYTPILAAAFFDLITIRTVGVPIEIKERTRKTFKSSYEW